MTCFSECLSMNHLYLGLVITHPVLRNGKIMYHSYNRRHQPNDFSELTVRRDVIITNIRRPITPGFISKADHFACFGIKLRMRRKCQTRQLAVEIIETPCL